MGTPACLEHGDFWAANVIATERGPVLIDWEDATLSHPFLGAYLLVASLDYADAIGDKAAARDRIRRAYLGPWREACPDRFGPAVRRRLGRAALSEPPPRGTERLSAWHARAVRGTMTRP